MFQEERPLFGLFYRAPKNLSSNGDQNFLISSDLAMFESNCLPQWQARFLIAEHRRWRMHLNISNQAITTEVVGCLSGAASQRLLPMASRLNPFSVDLLAITWVAYWQIDLYAASTYSSNQRWIRFHQRSERARSLTCAFSLFLHFVRLICFCLFNIILHFRCFSNLEWAAGGRRAECRGIPLCKLCSAESTKERRWARTRQSLIRN